jgi:hypothetical protein
MYKFILMLLLAAVSSSAMAAWDEISSSDDGLETHYVDRNSIQKKNLLVKMWSLADFKSTQRVEESISPMLYKSIAKQFEYDCKKNEYRMTAFNYYSDNFSKGDIVIGDSHVDKADWLQIAPHSLEEDLLKIACGK